MDGICVFVVDGAWCAHCCASHQEDWAGKGAANLQHQFVCPPLRDSRAGLRQ